jgi:hypothetical protein
VKGQKKKKKRKEKQKRRYKLHQVAQQPKQLTLQGKQR